MTGLKVLDLSRLLPGPYATLVLADLGATVDKVEEPIGGDYLRHAPPSLNDDSAMFYALNRNKRSLCLNLKSEHGAAAFKRLVLSYDVLLEGFRPGVMARLGLGYEALSEIHPKLIYCSLTGYGQTGPDRLQAGHDLNFLAKSGLLGLSGSPEGGPPMLGGQVADVGGGSLLALVGILTALFERNQTGRGRWVDISMADGALSLVHMMMGAYAARGANIKAPQPGGEPLNGGFPGYRVYETSDHRFLAVAAIEPKFFEKLCSALNRPDWFEQAYDAGAGAQVVFEGMKDLFRSQTLSFWLQKLGPLDVCVNAVQTPDEVLNDPHFLSRGLFVTRFDKKLEREVCQLKTPFSFGPMPFRSAPALGADSDEILAEAGFSDEERRALLDELGRG